MANRPKTITGRLAAGRRLEAVASLVKLAEQGRLTGDGLAAASRLLADSDLFVRGMAEWAIATKVGKDNNLRAPFGLSPIRPPGTGPGP